MIAALRLAERLEPGSTIVTVMCDTGMKYLSKVAGRAARVCGAGFGAVTVSSIAERHCLVTS